jgi:hypothetical protein
VMRPVLGDKQAGRSDTRIQFDPVNTLAIAIISEEMRRRHLTKLGELSSDTKKRLSQIYTELSRSLPDDPAAYSYAQMVRSETGTQLVSATRQVLRQIVSTAMENRALPLTKIAAANSATRLQGDALTNHLVREAARAAQKTPEEVRRQAFLLAITIGLTDSEILAQPPATAKLVSAIETPSERVIRLAVLGEPTMRGRRDLVRQFMLSAIVAAMTSGDAASAAGIAKELADAQGTSGFSFADLAADRAGVRFGRGVLERRIPIGVFAFATPVTAYMPEIEGLPERITAKDLATQYGGKDDPRFLKQLQEIDERIQRLPGYRPVGATSDR